MERVLPILFNTDMVRAILEGRKTVTRRLIKAPVLSKVEPPKKVTLKNGVANFEWNTPKTAGGFEIKPPYQPGDILYVRETWCENPNYKEYYFKTRPYGISPYGLKWHPSIHMPKEAARIWLKVKNVRVERLQDITEEQAKREGIQYDECPTGFTWKKETDMHNCYTTPIGAMQALWNSTIKKSDLDRYGWEANPYVWVIEFERCEKP